MRTGVQQRVRKKVTRAKDKIGKKLEIVGKTAMSPRTHRAAMALSGRSWIRWAFATGSGTAQGQLSPELCQAEPITANRGRFGTQLREVASHHSRRHTSSATHTWRYNSLKSLRPSANTRCAGPGRIAAPLLTSARLLNTSCTATSTELHTCSNSTEVHIASALQAGSGGTIILRVVIFFSLLAATLELGFRHKTTEQPPYLRLDILISPSSFRSKSIPGANLTRQEALQTIRSGMVSRCSRH